MDNLTKEQRRRNMRNIRSAGTGPEKMVAKELRKAGLYFAQNVNNLPGKPDFVFRRKKVVVFLDSDFWHGHPKRFIMPQTNLEYWRPKIKRNMRRDKEITKLLKKSSWKVLRFWEHDVKRKPERCVQKILNILERPE